MDKNMNDLVNQLKDLKVIEKLDESNRFGDISQAMISKYLSELKESDTTVATTQVIKEFSISGADAVKAVSYWVAHKSVKESKVNEDTRAVQIEQIMRNKIRLMQQRAKDPEWTDNDPDQVAMYLQDAKDLQAILAAFLAGNFKLVDKLITNLDTAVRDELPVKIIGYANYTPFNVKTQREYRP